MAYKPVFTPEWRRKISEAKKGEKNAAWKGGLKQKANCLYCAKEFTDWLYKNRRYCSISCGLRGNRETDPILLAERSRKRKEYKRQYRAKNMKKIVFQNNHRRTVKKTVGTHTIEQWEQLKKTYRHMCLCCKQQEPEITLTEDHIVPVSQGGSNYIWNIQPLCRDCNNRKFTKAIDYRPTITIH